MKKDELPGSIRSLLNRFVPGPWGASVVGDFEELWKTSSQTAVDRAGLLLRALGVSLSFQALHWQRLSISESYGESLFPDSKAGWPLSWVESLVRDVSHSCRRLFKAPGFFIVAVLIMGLGIGANTAMFSVVNSLLWERQPLGQEEDLVRFYTNQDESDFPDGGSYLDFLDYSKDNPLLVEAAFTNDMGFLNLISDRGSEVVMGEYYTPKFMKVAGLELFMGRHFVPEEGDPGVAPAVSIVSHAEWESRYGSDPSILGRKIRINGNPVTVVGVAPRGYGGTVGGFEASYFVPIGSAAVIDPAVARALEQRESRAFYGFGRLAPGVSVQQLKASFDTRALQLKEEYPESNRHYSSVLVIPSRDVQMHPALDIALLPIAAILMSVVGLVLLVACSNLANLLLMRAASRGREVAVRRALGASRWRLVKLLLTESSLLGVIGGAIGWVLAIWLSRLLLSFESPMPVPLALEPSLDYRVLLFTALISVGTGLLFGLVPALRASRLDLVSSLKNTQPGSDLTGRRFNLRKFFVTVQVATSLLLLSVGGLCLHSLLAGQDRDFGFNSNQIALAVIDAELGGYTAKGEAGRFYEVLRERLLRETGIQNVAYTHRIPYGFFGTDRLPYSSDQAAAAERPPEVEYAIVEKTFFDVMGIPLLAGRPFTAGLTTGEGANAIVSRSFAEREWGHIQVVGESLQIEGTQRRTLRIVGVAEDLQYSTDETEMLYLPYVNQPTNPLIVLARGQRSAEALTPLLRQVIQEVDGQVPVFEAKTMTEHLGIAFFIPRLLGILLSVFGLVAITLAGVGLYGLIAYSVENRSREMAVRMTLGAETRQVILLVMREGMGLVVVGAILGILLSALLSVPLSAILYGITPLDPLVLGGILLVLLTIAALAS